MAMQLTKWTVEEIGEYKFRLDLGCPHGWVFTLVKLDRPNGFHSRRKEWVLECGVGHDDPEIEHIGWNEMRSTKAIMRALAHITKEYQVS